MAEIFPALDTATRVDIAPPSIPANSQEQVVTGPLDARFYFEGVTENDRELNSTLLAIDAQHWIESIPGLKNRSGIFVDSISQKGHNENGGVPYQSIKMADAINFVKTGSKPEKELINEKGYSYRTDITEEDYNLLIDTAPNEGLALLMRMRRDIDYPQDYSGVPVLTPKPSGKARDIEIMHHGKRTAQKGMFCGEAEGRFMNSTFREGGLEEIKIGDQVIALKKDNGERTALLVHEATLHGVLLPKGSIVTVDLDDLGEPEFAFARLSAFAVSSPQEIEAMSPYLSSNKHFVENIEGYNRVRQLLGQGAGVTEAELQASLDSIDEYFAHNENAQNIATLLEEKIATIDLMQEIFKLQIADAYSELHVKYPPEITFINPEDTTEQKTQKLANCQMYDAESAQIEALNTSVQNPTVAYKQTLTELIHTFGIEEVRQTQRLLRDRALAQRSLLVAA
jgi:hypothetical protein